MNNSIKDYHRKPTYDELIQEAIIHPTDMIKYPNRIATQLRNTPQLTRFDDENFLDTAVLNSNAMKQNMQQTALQKATQPVARYIKTGLEQFDIHDTDDAIQQQADDNTADLKDLEDKKKKKDEAIVDIFEEGLSNPSSIHDIIKQTGNLRGSGSASSTAPPADYKPDETEIPTSKPKPKSKSQGNLRGLPTEQEDENKPDSTPLKPVNQIVEHIDMIELEIKANKHLKRLITEIKQNIENDIHTTDANDKLKERFELQTLLTELNKHSKTRSKSKKSKTPQAIEDLADMHDIYTKLNKILDKSK